jgi:hypothetical protein
MARSSPVWNRDLKAAPWKHPPSATNLPGSGGYAEIERRADRFGNLAWEELVGEQGEGRGALPWFREKMKMENK